MVWSEAEALHFGRDVGIFEPCGFVGNFLEVENEAGFPAMN